MVVTFTDQRPIQCFWLCFFSGRGGAAVLPGGSLAEERLPPRGAGPLPVLPGEAGPGRRGPDIQGQHRVPD